MTEETPSQHPTEPTTVDLLKLLSDQLTFNLKVVRAMVILRDRPRKDQDAALNELADDLSEMLDSHMKVVRRAYGYPDVD